MGKKKAARKSDDIKVDGDHVRDAEQKYFKDMEEKISDELKKRRQAYKRAIEASKKSRDKREECRLSLIAQMTEEGVRRLPMSTDGKNGKAFVIGVKDVIKIEKIKPVAQPVEEESIK